MAIEKKYSKDKKICKVTFTIPKETAQNFDTISLVGEFNQWDPKANVFAEVGKDGSFECSLELESGKEYQFRYLADGETWLNEPDADKFVPTHYGDSENSVIVI